MQETANACFIFIPDRFVRIDTFFVLIEKRKDQLSNCILDYIGGVLLLIRWKE